MSGYGSRRRRGLVVALMLAALSTGVGFVVVNGWWVPAAKTTADAQSAPPLLSRVPCVALDGGLPCVASVPGGTVTNASVTTKSGDAAVPEANSVDHRVVAADQRELALAGKSLTTDTDLNSQSALLLARNAENSGASYPGDMGAAMIGSGAANGGLGSHAPGTSQSVGLVNGATASQSSSASSAASSVSSSSGAASSGSGGAPAPTPGTASGTRAFSAEVPAVATGEVPPVSVEHTTTVSDLTRGRSDSGKPISIVVGGAGEPISSTPEPSSILLIGTGVVGLGVFLKRRRAAAGTTPQV